MAGLGRVAFVHPWLEVGRRKVWERETEVGQIAFRVDQQRRYSGAERLFDENDAEAGLARAGHAHDHAVGREVGCLQQHRLAVALVVAVDALAEEELARGHVGHGDGS